MISDSAPSPGRLRVLIVDDNRDCADTLVELLQALGHNALASYGADSGLEIALAFRPQLILLDLAMPAKSGVVLIRELRNGAGLAKVPIVALTGFADGPHREEAAEAGFDAYLVKPCRLAELRMVLKVAELSG